MTSNSSSPSGSINTLQIALIAMKDRCQRQQKRVEELERENLMMAEVRADLYNEVKRLHETNVKLREKNLQLNNEVRLKSNECVEVREALSKSKTNNSSNARQLQRLQNEFSMIANRERRASNRDKDSIDEDHPTEMLMSLTPDNDTSTLDNISYSQFNEEDSCKLLEKTTSRMSTIKQTLLSEQQAIMEAIQTLEHRRAIAAQNAESLISASLAAAQKLSVRDEMAEREVQGGGGGGDRKCPMCEASFPKTVSHDEFESHVVEHFSFEESDTLTNFDTVPDAYWSSHSGVDTSQDEESSMYR